MSRLPLLLAGAAALALPAGASAAAPANDAPAGAVPFAAFTAANGTPTELTGTAELAEATADAGVPRCLGARSFASTAWLKVPAGDAARTLRLTAIPASGEPDQQPQLAAFVQPAGGTQTAEPQACDGGPGGPDRTAGVELAVPGGREVLIQVGREQGATLNRVVVALAAAPVRDTAVPLGDLGTMAAPRLTRGRASVVPVGGALLTEEDPAQPACPAAGSVWRRATAARTGTHVAAARGSAAGTVTVFAGARPTGDGAVACANRTAGDTTATTFRARRGQALWVRVGTDVGATGGVRLALSGPCDVLPLTAAGRKPKVRILGVSGRRARVRVTGGCLKAVRLTAGGRPVGRASVLPAGTRTVRLTRALRGRVGLRLTARDAARKTGGAVRAARTVRAR